ncbi:uncharacterized protein [Spinacia oleracea]|uniref:Uncharacterized protein n=1 Tax=Spinacia oleracea TaxID=3562 RepID=A0A9R0JYE6_SPIOL|nr:uncharacterized protein LOC110790675 [Spinacia oleracea]
MAFARYLRWDFRYKFSVKSLRTPLTRSSLKIRCSTISIFIFFSFHLINSSYSRLCKQATNLHKRDVKHNRHSVRATANEYLIVNVSVRYFITDSQVLHRNVNVFLSN